MVKIFKKADNASRTGLTGRKKLRKQNLIAAGFIVLILMLIAFISNLAFFRLDLTAEKRYTLAPSTRQLIESLDDALYFKVYLEGDELPAGFRRLRNSIRETLEEFRAISKENIQYEFINPLESNDTKTRNEIGRDLRRRGLMPTSVENLDAKGNSEKLVLFPGLILSFKGRDIAVDLLKNNLRASAEENLNYSIEALEFELVSAIRRLQITNRNKIAFIEGHGELNEKEVFDFTRSLSDYYEISRVKIDGRLNALEGFKGIVVAGPDSSFSDKDKFVIDQFIMKGGKSLWFVDGTDVNMDSLSLSSETMGLVNELNLTDQLFKYGVRVNPNLLMDIQSAYIPINVAPMGSEPQFKPFSWYFFPLLSPTNHIISLNLNLIKSEFSSSVDTVGNDNRLKKTVLLTSSKYTKLVNAPARVSLEIINQEPVESQYNKSFIPVAVLLEGYFTSVFKNRLSDEFTQNPEFKFVDESVKNQMIVVADGDLIRNQFKGSGNQVQPYPLGFDRYTGQTFGNKDFALNCLNYLMDDSSILAVRSREIKIRMLDREKILSDSFYWKIFNTLIPILIVLVFALILSYMRKRKYSLPILK
jgi:ABC-2 type transport system permease protein